MDNIQQTSEVIDGREEESEQNISLKNSVPLKLFVPAKTESPLNNQNKKIIVSSGFAVKSSYIDIVGQDNFLSVSNKKFDSSDIPKKTNRIKTKNKKYQLLNVNDVMKAAESNDVSKIDEFLKNDKNFVLNVKDQFGWTAMMSACCAGSKDVVKLLLLHKPDVNVADNTGNTCLKLAQRKCHNHIVSLLNDYLNSSEIGNIQSDNTNISTSEECTSFYCEVCKEIIKLSDSSHFTSTVHLFNSSRKSGVPTAYGIPESNVGFQMLLKTGWDREKGLGPEGSGHKFPPKTMLKQDRAGLGAKKYISRVTHDPHLAIKVHKETQRTLKRRERLQNEIKNKRKERELRRALD